MGTLDSNLMGSARLKGKFEQGAPGIQSAGRNVQYPCRRDFRPASHMRSHATALGGLLKRVTPNTRHRITAVGSYYREIEFAHSARTKFFASSRRQIIVGRADYYPGSRGIQPVRKVKKAVTPGSRFSPVIAFAIEVIGRTEKRATVDTGTIRVRPEPRRFGQRHQTRAMLPHDPDIP